jgi:Nuclease-related domain
MDGLRAQRPADAACCWAHSDSHPMQISIFSDHTGSMAHAAQDRRTDAYHHALAGYEQSVASRAGLIQARKRDVVNSLSPRSLLKMPVSLFRLGAAYASDKPVPPVMSAPDDAEMRWRHGKEGEQRLVRYLSSLNDHWTLIGGYRNASGEIDQVLVGPFGVFALEVKYINGVVHCDGDQWWSDKYDRNGNLVEAGKPLQDRCGRGPSRQLNEASNRLERLLRQHCSIHRVARVVVLSHDASRLGQITNQTVDIVATVYELNLNVLCERSQDRCDPDNVQRIVQTMWQDHCRFQADRD